MARQKGTVELLPFELYIGAANPSGTRSIDVLLSGVSPLVLYNAISLNYVKAFGKCEQVAETYIDSVTAEGKCEQTGTPTPSSPVDIKCNNGVIGIDGQGNVTVTGTQEVVSVMGKNLFNVNNPYKSGYAITQNGNETIVQNFSIYSLKVEPLTTYTYSCNYTESVTTRIHSYDKNGNWIQQNTYGNANTTKTFKTTSDTAEIRISINNSAALSAQLELGSTATDYQPYVTPQTATCENLLSVGTYKDLQNITTGSVTRNVGIHVFNGEESFNTLSGGAIRFTVAPTAGAGFTPYCTHYAGVDSSISAANMPDLSIKSHNSSANNLYIKDLRFATADAFKEYVKSLYNAGTPIIMLYKLDTATSESVTAQSLSVAQGTNVVSAEGSVDNLELEVSYKAAVTVTVEEIEAVQLDENVVVTIS